MPEVVLQRPVSRPSFASLYQAVHGDAMTAILNATITAPGTFFGQAFMPGDKRQPFVAQHHNIESAFSYGSGGASVDVYVQVSHDGDANWKDIAHFAQLTTSSVRALWRTNSADSVLDADAQHPAPFASWWRVKCVVVGTYANTTLRLDVIGANLVQAGVGP